MADIRSWVLSETGIEEELHLLLVDRVVETTKLVLIVIERVALVQPIDVIHLPCIFFSFWLILICHWNYSSQSLTSGPFWTNSHISFKHPNVEDDDTALPTIPNASKDDLPQVNSS